jgi:hypothetical protein
MEKTYKMHEVQCLVVDSFLGGMAHAEKIANQRASGRIRKERMTLSLLNERRLLSSPVNSTAYGSKAVSVNAAAVHRFSDYIAFGLSSAVMGAVIALFFIV